MKDLQAVPDYWSKLAGDGWPAKAAVGFAGAVSALMFPNAAGRSAAAAVLVLVAVDTVTGTIAARLSGEAISSAKFGRAVVKVFSYFTAILAVALGFRALPGLESAYEPAISSVTSLMVLTELLSVFENLQRMGFPMPDWILKLLASGQDRISKGP